MLIHVPSISSKKKKDSPTLSASAKQNTLLGVYREKTVTAADPYRDFKPKKILW
jgi:hypothetical protein